MEDHAFIGITIEIIVPIQQGGGHTGGGLKDVHAHQPGNVGLAGAGQKIVGHHAHETAGDDAVKLFERGPALNSTRSELLVAHPAVDGYAEFGHAQEAVFRDAGSAGVILNRTEFVLQIRLVVLHLFDPAQSFREIERLDSDAAGFEQLFAVADGIEGRGTRAERSDARVLQFPQHVAGRGEPAQIGAEFLAVRIHRVLARKRKANAVLAEVVADRHFPTEAVAAMFDGHLFAIVIECVDKDRHVEPGPAQGIGHRALIAKVRQCHQHTVNIVTMRFEQIGTFLRVGQRLDGAEFARLNGQGYGLDPLLTKHAQDFTSARFAQMCREKAAVPDNDA